MIFEISELRMQTVRKVGRIIENRYIYEGVVLGIYLLLHRGMVIILPPCLDLLCTRKFSCSL